MEPAVVTFKPDNFLTVGLIVAIVYLGAVLIAQLAMRGGLLPSAAKTAGASVVA